MSEVFRIQQSDIDWQNQRLRLWTRKRQGGGYEFDWIPVIDELETILKEQIKEYPFQKYLFEPEGKCFDRWTREMIPELCSVAKVHQFGFHGIRHLSASLLDAAGVSTKVIQSILRHKNLSTTDRYLHSLRGVKADLNSAFGKKIALQIDTEKG